MIRALKDTRKYRMPWHGHPRAHEELAWDATDDDSVLGVVIRDRVDHDFSWVALTQIPAADTGWRLDNQMRPHPIDIPAGTYCTNDLAVSRPTVEIATAELHAAMRRIAREIRK
jgi:hypothetical protein